MPSRQNRVARLGAHVRRQPRKRRVPEPSPIRHQPQDPLVVQRQVRDVAGRGGRRIPPPEGVAQAPRRGGQCGGEVSRPVRQSRARRGKRRLVRRSGRRGRRRRRRVRRLLRNGDRHPRRRAHDEQHNEPTSHTARLAPARTALRSSRRPLTRRAAPSPPHRSLFERNGGRWFSPHDCYRSRSRSKRRSLITAPASRMIASA